jgi:hypothetical protein
VITATIFLLVKTVFNKSINRATVSSEESISAFRELLSRQEMEEEFSGQERGAVGCSFDSNTSRFLKKL